VPPWMAGRGRASESIYNVSSGHVVILGCRINSLDLSPADDPVLATPRNDDPCIAMSGCESINMLVILTYTPYSLRN
jgi:hypothetical protein